MNLQFSKCEKYGPLVWFLLAFIILFAQNNKAHAQNLVLRDNIYAQGKNIVIGDIFENSGIHANKILAIAPRPNQKTVFSAPILSQRLAAYGLKWSVPKELKEIVIFGDSLENTSLIIEKPTQTEAKNGEIAVLNRDIMRDEEISFDMIEFIEAPQNIGKDIIQDAAILVGARAKTNLKKNSPIRNSEIGPALAVKRGQQVLIIQQIGGIKITLQAKSLDNGSIGSKIRVVNLQSNRTLEAIIEANGQAKVLGPINNLQSIAAK